MKPKALLFASVMALALGLFLFAYGNAAADQSPATKPQISHICVSGPGRPMEAEVIWKDAPASVENSQGVLNAVGLRVFTSTVPITSTPTVTPTGTITPALTRTPTVTPTMVITTTQWSTFTIPLAWKKWSGPVGHWSGTVPAVSGWFTVTSGWVGNSSYQVQKLPAPYYFGALCPQPTAVVLTNFTATVASPPEPAWLVWARLANLIVWSAAIVTWLLVLKNWRTSSKPEKATPLVKKPA